MLRKSRIITVLVIGLLLFVGPVLAETKANNVVPNNQNESADSHEQPPESLWQPTAWDPITAFTCVLAAVGILQLLLIWRQARISARQTVISELSMTIGKQPQIYVDDVLFTIWTSDNRTLLSLFNVTYNIYVVGDTPAIFRSVGENLFFLVHPPEEPPLSDWTDPYVRENGEHISRVIGLEATDDMNREIQGRNFSLDPKPKAREFFLIGRVVFDDVFGNQHELGFCFSSSRYGGRGRIYGGSKHNYRRIRHGKERI